MAGIYFKNTGIRQSFNCINGIIRFNFDIPIHNHIPVNLTISSWYLGNGNNIIIDGEFSEVKHSSPLVNRRYQPLRQLPHQQPHSSQYDYHPLKPAPDQQTSHPSQLR